MPSKGTGADFANSARPKQFKVLYICGALCPGIVRELAANQRQLSPQSVLADCAKIFRIRNEDAGS